jgi:hypothetical protein
VWDLGLRAAYRLPSLWAAGEESRLVLDLEHIGSPREAVDYEQLHFTCLDSGGNQACPNAGYGRVRQYQPPMTARLGLELAL